jgi:hypothetical protein
MYATIAPMPKNASLDDCRTASGRSRSSQGPVPVLGLDRRRSGLPPVACLGIFSRSRAFQKNPPQFADLFNALRARRHRMATGPMHSDCHETRRRDLPPMQGRLPPHRARLAPGFGRRVSLSAVQHSDRGFRRLEPCGLPPDGGAGKNLRVGRRISGEPRSRQSALRSRRMVNSMSPPSTSRQLSTALI